MTGIISPNSEGSLNEKLQCVIVYSPSMCRMSNVLRHSSKFLASGEDYGYGRVAYSIADIYYKLETNLTN